MPRSTKEWIGKTDDSMPPPRVRLRIFDRHNGICGLSGRKIRTGEKWHLHHVKGLLEGGQNRESNMVPVLVEPHKAETKRQRKVKKKVDAVRAKHIGAVEPKREIESPGFYKKPKVRKIDKSALPPLGGPELVRRTRP